MFRVLIFDLFSKKPNSTRRPSGSEWVAAWKYDCVLKEPSSMINPVISLDLRMYEDDEYMMTLTPARWNYAYIEKFGRYYWITDIEFDHGLTTIYLECDVLASFKEEIEDETAYITRSSKYRDSLISDAFYPAKMSMIEHYIDCDTNDTAMVEYSENGCYIVGVINASSNYTAVTYYALNYTQFSALKYALFSVQNYTEGHTLEVSNELLKVLYNPFQYISSVLYVPFAVSNFIEEGQLPEMIEFGWWNGATGVNATGYKLRLTTSVFLYCGSVTFYPHPEAGAPDTIDDDLQVGIAPFSGLGQYLNFAPYTQYFLRFEPFGFFELDNQTMGQLMYFNSESQQVTLMLNIKLDLITGKAYLHINPILDSATAENQFYFTPMEGQIGVPLQLGQITADTMGGQYTVIRTAANALSRVAGEASRFKPFSAAARAAEGVFDMSSAIYDGKKEAAPKLVTNGSNGSFIAFKELIYGYERNASMCENDPEEAGYPLMKNLQIKDCKPGFILCGFTDIKIPGCTEPERQKIISHLTSGVYLEEDEG